MKAFALLPFAFLLAGCMTASPKAYQPVATASHFKLAEDLMFTTRVSSGLAAGRYTAAFESQDHVYYLGEPRALILGSGTRVNGGIAMRKPGAAADCHMFIQVGDDSQAVRDQGMGPVIAGLAKLEAGRIREFKEDPGCAAVLPRIQISAG